MKSPAEYYVRYLILNRYTDQRVNGLITQLGYPQLGAPYLRTLRSRVQPPKPFRPGTKHKLTDKWLEQHGLLALYERDDHLDDATALLSNAMVRPLLEAMLLAGATIADTAAAVSKRSGKHYSEQSLAYYKHYFWNRDLLTTTEWEEFLDTYSQGSQLKGLYDEGPDMVNWRLGFPVAGLDANDMLKAMQVEAFYRFMQTHNMKNDKDTAKTAAGWASVVFEANKLLNSGDTQLNDVISQFEAIYIKKSQQSVPGVETIGHNHSAGKLKAANLPPLLEVDNYRQRVLAQREEEEILNEG